MSHAVRFGALLLTLQLLGCSAAEPSDGRVAFLDRTVFEQSIQPDLSAACANASCHGRPERALSLYAARHWRADPTRLHLDEPLSSAELDHNYSVSCAMAWADELLLRKPLAHHADTYHGGGAVFDGVTDERYRALRDWARGDVP